MEASNNKNNKQTKKWSLDHRHNGEDEEDDAHHHHDGVTILASVQMAFYGIIMLISLLIVGLKRTNERTNWRRQILIVDDGQVAIIHHEINKIRKKTRVVSMNNNNNEKIWSKIWIVTDRIISLIQV